MADRADALSPAPVRSWGGIAATIGLLILALVETAWFVWYCVMPLPNAEAARTTLPSGEIQSEAIRRWYLLAEAVPHFIPGNTWGESLVGKAFDSLVRLQYLPQRVPLALAGLLIAAGGTGLGLLILRGLKLSDVLSRAERLGLAFGLGLTATSALTLGLGRAGWLAPWPIRVGLGALAAGGLALELLAARWITRLPGPSEPKLRARSVILFGLLAAPFVWLMILGSLQPSIDFDALEYHLQGPKEWYQAGRITFLPHNVYTSMPFSVEMLHLLGMVVVGDWWRGALVGQFVIMLHGLMTALMIGLAATRLGAPRAGWVAALVYLATPWTYRLSVFAYVEGPLVYYHAATILAAMRALAAGRTAGAFWCVCGGLAGGAMACKYPALISAVVPFSALALADAIRRRRGALMAAFVAGLALAVGPWLVKNIVDHGNPVYPLAYRVFGGHPWSPEREAQWSRAHGPRPITGGDLASGALDVAGRNDWQSPLYVALAPLALLRRQPRRAAAALWIYSLYLFATWWLLTHRLDRFWLPMLAPLAILAGLGADWTRRRGWPFLLGLIVGFGLFASWVHDTTALAAMNRWTDDMAVLRDDIPRMASPSLMWLDENLNPGAKVLLVGPAGVFHMKHAIVYNTVFDDETIEQLAAGRESQSVGQALRDRGITHVWVDWSEIARHRKPGGYGFTDFVQPELFARLVQDGILEPMSDPIPEKDLYRVRAN